MLSKIYQMLHSCVPFQAITHLVIPAVKRASLYALLPYLFYFLHLL